MTANPPVEDRAEELAGQMSFLDHLEELRTRLIRILIALVVAFLICWTFSAQLVQVVSVPIDAALQPGQQMVFTTVTGPFNLFIKVSFVAAVFLASPFIVAQIWLFIAPGLYKHERRYAIPFILAGTILAICGGVFGYFVAFPFAVQFLIGWGESANLTPMIEASRYFDLFLMIELALAFIFQIPPVIFVLSRVGLVSAGFLLRNTKYAVLIAFVVAAVITPTPDPVNMTIMAGPMVLLYLVGIAVAFLFGKKEKD